MPPDADLIRRDGLRLFTLDAALSRVPEAFFERHPIEAQIVLNALRDESGLLRRLLEGGHSVIAGRLAGAFRRIGRIELADEILSSMRSADYDVRESDPFAPEHGSIRLDKTVAPIVSRLRALWATFREPVVDALPPAPGLPKDDAEYMRSVDEVYQTDAYHSLSIEGYRVTPELIERVRKGNWNADGHPDDQRERDALAARGYWQAFQRVRDSVQSIIAGADAASLVRSAHRDWYRELFQPGVSVGLIPASALAGYRGHPVYLRGSRHVPPRWEAVPDAMTALFDLLAAEPEPAVRAVLGHWMFGYTRAFPDGNGRVARFVMNAMLASGDYRWTVIRVEDRDEYMQALESASVGQDIAPFARFIGQRLGSS